MACALGSSCARSSARVRVQRQRQRRLDLALRQALEDAAVADGGKHQVLVADAAGGAEQVDGLEHVVHVVRRLAHAHEHHLAHLAPAPRQHHLGDDLGTAELAQQAAAPGHAKTAADGAADLGRHAHAVARQQHAFHGLAIGQFEQAGAPTHRRRMLGAHPRQAIELAPSAGKAARSVAGKKSAAGTGPLIQRPAAGPGAQDAFGMDRSGAGLGQAPMRMSAMRMGIRC
jgi:hypothetical protein